MDRDCRVPEMLSELRSADAGDGLDGVGDAEKNLGRDMA